jgi:O-antigen/teichoic acid export membrane protein
MVAHVAACAAACDQTAILHRDALGAPGLDANAVNTIAKKSIETFVVRSFNQAATLAVGILIARMLGPSGKGIYAYALTVLGLLVSIASGQTSAIARQLAKGKQPPRIVYGALLRTVAIFAVPISTVLVVVALVQPTQRVLLAAAIALPLVVYMALANGFFLSASDVRSSNLQTLVQSLVLLIGVPVAALLRGNLAAILAAWIISYIVATAFSTVRLRAYLKPVSQSAPIHYPFREQLFFGLKTTLNTAVEELNLRINIFLILGMLGAAALGIYSLGIGIAGLLWQLSRPIATAAFGRIGSEDEAQAADLTARCMRHSLAFVMAASIVAFIIGPWLLVVVYGSKFAAAGGVLRLLLPGVVAYCIMPLLATFYTQQLGRPMIPLALSAISTVICAATTAVLIPRFGIAAAAVATSVSYIVAVGIAAILFVRQTGIAPTKLFFLDRQDLQQYWFLAGSLFARLQRLRRRASTT